MNIQALSSMSIIYLNAISVQLAISADFLNYTGLARHIAISAKRLSHGYRFDNRAD